MLKVPAVLGCSSRTFPSVAMARDVSDVAIAACSPSRGKGYGARTFAEQETVIAEFLSKVAEFGWANLEAVQAPAGPSASAAGSSDPQWWGGVHGAPPAERRTHCEAPLIGDATQPEAAKVSAGGFFVEGRGPDERQGFTGAVASAIAGAVVLEAATGGMCDGKLFEGVGAVLALDSRSNPKRPVLTDKVAVLYLHGEAGVYSGLAGAGAAGVRVVAASTGAAVTEMLGIASLGSPWTTASSTRGLVRSWLWTPVRILSNPC